MAIEKVHFSLKINNYNTYDYNAAYKVTDNGVLIISDERSTEVWSPTAWQRIVMRNDQGG